MTKEEILDSKLGDFTREMLSDEDIYSAMDEYAQQCAVGFAKWMDDNHYSEYYRGHYSNDKLEDPSGTLSELYAHYLTNKDK